MVIDCHYHLEKRMLTVEELLHKMDESDVQKTALIGYMLDPFPEPSPALVGLLQFLLAHPAFRGICKLLVANFTAEGEVKILGKAYKIYRDPDNAAVFKTVARHPDRFLGWVFVNPRGNRNQEAEFEQWKDVQGFVGVKAHPFWNHHTPLELMPVAKKIAAIGKPLLIHAGYDAEGYINTLLQAVPDLKLILAHAGFPLYKGTWEAIKSRKNVFVDLSQTTYVGEKTIRQVVGYLGVDRCLFGTDGPYGFHGTDGKIDYGLIKRRIERLFPDEGVQDRLLGKNFAELAGIR